MRNKLKRFQELSERDHVVEPNKPLFESIRGHWDRFFENDHPITFEIGCGKGEYTVALARKYPDQNFVGVELKGARIWVGSNQVLEENLTNAAFLRAHVLDIEKQVAENEAAALWITFSDPRPRDRDAKRRLTSARYLDIYQRIVRPGGWVHIKTDDDGLFDFTLDVLAERDDVREMVYTRDLYASDLYEADQQIVTGYEAKFVAQGKTIKYLRFQFSSNTPLSKG